MVIGCCRYKIYVANDVIKYQYSHLSLRSVCSFYTLASFTSEVRIYSKLTVAMIILLLTAFAILAAMYLCYCQFYRPYYQLPRIIGLKGPKPELIFGNFRQLSKAGRNAPKQYDEWYQKYGPNYLLFMGVAPMIVTQDPEMIKDVLVRNFDNFVDRSSDDANLLRCILKANKSLATYTGDDWRRLRRILTPGFSSKKIKLLSPIIEMSCKQLTEAIGKQADKDVSADVTECFDAFSMEVILTSIFGRVCNLQNGVNDLAKAVKAAFAKTFGHMYGQELAFTLSSHFSFLAPIIHFLVKKSQIAKQWIPVQDIAAHLINERKKSGTKRNDMLQYMLDTVEDQDTLNGLADHHSKMTMDEILSTAVLIIFSGMGHNMTFLGYLLATNPEVQNRLVQDIKSFFENNPDATLYEAAESIEYAEMIIRELLRLYPAINLITRYCTETCTTSNGTVIPKGAIVYIPAYNIQHNPKFWPDPEKFDPERFGPKATFDSSTYLAFGSGPRMCPGQQYSHIKIKMALISMLKQYKFVRADDTEAPPEIDNFFQVTPVRHLKVKVVSV